MGRPLGPLELDFDAVQLVPAREVVNIPFASMLIQELKLLSSVGAIISEVVVALLARFLQSLELYVFRHGSHGRQCCLGRVEFV